MDDLTLVTLGFTAGFVVPIIAMVAWWEIRDRTQRYVDAEIREAKNDLREFVREREGR